MVDSTELPTNNNDKLNNKNASIINWEKCQFFNSIAQTLILFATMIGALIIGFTQNKISENLLNLSYRPSTEVVYEMATKRILVYNKGPTNIWLWGTQYLDYKPNIKNDPLLISPGGNYYILADKFHDIILDKVKTEGSTFVPFILYITGEDGSKYIVKNRLYCQIENENLIIHSQTLAINLEKWSSGQNK